MKTTVSVIIPTYNRPGLLRETLETVWKQTVLPDEILIGDDSANDETEELVNETLIPMSPVPIRYFHHKPSLREVRNVDHLYANATGDLLLHLHDDDPIYPRCVELLKAPLEEHGEAVGSFGLQRIIDEGGNLIPDAESVNEGYFRTAERAGLVPGVMAGAVGMIPNNGFMVRRAAACEVGYSDHGRAGLATDLYFGFRLGMLEKPLYFVHEFTSMVRLTSQSQSRDGNSDNAYRAVMFLEEDLRPDQYTPEIDRSFYNRIPIAITIAARKGDRKRALRWMFSKYYRTRLFSLRGIKRMLMILAPGLFKMGSKKKT